MVYFRYALLWGRITSKTGSISQSKHLYTNLILILSWSMCLKITVMTTLTIAISFHLFGNFAALVKESVQSVVTGNGIVVFVIPGLIAGVSILLENAICTLYLRALKSSVLSFRRGTLILLSSLLYRLYKSILIVCYYFEVQQRGLVSSPAATIGVRDTFLWPATPKIFLCILTRWIQKNLGVLTKSGAINPFTGNVSYMIKKKSCHNWRCIIYDQVE